MKLSSRWICTAILATILCGSLVIPSVTPTASAATSLPTGFGDALVTGGLNTPTAMTFSPDGRLFVSEKDGNLRVIKNGALLSTPFVSLSVNSEGERGLLGIAFDPNYASNHYVYVYYTTASSPIHNRVSRFTADPANPDVALAGSEVPILNLESLVTVSHNGGAIHFGSDGKLYISVGDNYYSYNAQSLTSRFGKILRINADGTIPSDNPFYNVQGAYKEIWALGLRNPFTFSFSPITGSTLMYINDVGQDTWEEIDSGLRGGNYGWPNCEGACSSPSYINPVYVYAHPSDGSGSSIAGGAFYEAAQFPSTYKDSYFFGDYVQGWIKRLTPQNQVINFASGITSPVAVDVGPDGSLYYLSIVSGEVHKIRYSSAANNYPTAVASANPSSGTPPLSVTFSGSGSIDTDNDPLTYSWNFGDGSPTAGGLTVTHTYSNVGTYTSALTVSDGKGGTDTSTVKITVGHPPVPTISTPISGIKYNAGDTISFSGSATDAKDGNNLPASAFQWTVLFHHNTHTHPFQQYVGVKSGSFTIPTTGETDDNVWYRIYLTVTNSDGLSTTVTRDVTPNKSTDTINSNISGLTVLLDGQPHPMPYSFTGVVGIVRTMEALATQTTNGQTENFVSWSDGGARIHTISTPPQATTFTATYNTGSSGGQQTLTVNSADLSGTTHNGYYTTISSGSTTVQTGFTPLTFTGTQGSTYTITVSDYGGATFDHWENGSTSRTRSVTLSENTAITAFYRTSSSPPPSSYNLSVRSVDLSGNAIAGYYATISSGGSAVQAGYTPLTYIGNIGASYSVTIEDYGNAKFDHWEDGSTSRTRAVTLNTNLILTAYFSTVAAQPQLTITSFDLSGNSITGYYTSISSGGSVVSRGFTPLTFTGNMGSTYTILVQDYGSFVFDHWENGSTVRERTLTLSADTPIKAFYRSNSNPVLTVKSVNTAGAAIVGYYTSIASGGATIATGFTPMTFTGTPGVTYTVSVSDYGSYVFDHWENGSTIRGRTMTLNSNTDVTAYYRNTAALPTLTVTSADLSGNTITGYYTTISSNGNIISTGFTPHTFAGNAGAIYTVAVSDYGSFVFDHWENGSTTRSRTITLDADASIKAFYKSG